MLHVDRDHRMRVFRDRAIDSEQFRIVENLGALDLCECTHPCLQPLRRWRLLVRRDLRQRRHNSLQPAFRNSIEQCALGGEVFVDVGMAHIERARDVHDARFRGAVASQHIDGGVENAVPD